MIKEFRKVLQACQDDAVIVGGFVPSEFKEALGQFDSRFQGFE
jgi:hypothetical protein